ncbi:extracellular solute-binding protein (plasmid) [Mesorhizobium sp. AR10]|uniref:extracellular solute-binding protein n=1 Tax=Mesorhizobium sp. AR10 TaxID=2865839 RepID=UPI0021600740|nr:extracellular solute-binding protein [Mesorhizobium sp. AR10]UVK35515.1 extracellular solute-binding protein [Mesorhizobium sp. AR10]
MLELTRRHFLAGSSSILFTTGAIAPAEAAEGLRIVALPSIFGDMFKALRDEFVGRRNVKVGLDTSIREDEKAITTILRNAVVGEIPDVLFISPNYLRVFVDRHLAQDLDVFQRTETDWAENYSAAVTRIGKFKGNLDGLGFAVSMPVVLYNLDLLARAGVNTPPDSWEDIIALGRKIDDLRQGNVVGGFMEYDNGGNWTFHGLLNGFGGRILANDDRSIGFAGPEGLAALKVLQGFGQCGQSRVDMSRDQARQAFSAGQLGILCTSSSSYEAIEKRSQGRFQIAMRPFPTGTQMGYLPAAGPVSIMFSNNAEQQQRSWDFMKFASSVAGQTVMATRTAYLPANDLSFQDERLKTYYSSRPNLSALVPALSKMGPWEAFPGENSVKITTVIKDHLASVVLQKATPQQALEQMSRDVSDLMSPR